MSWGDDWHHNSVGEVVDKNGYNADGVYVGGERRPQSNINNSTGGSGSNTGSGSNSAAGIGSLVGLGIIGFIIYQIYVFITEYWVPIVTILGICVLCFIICLIIRKVSKSLGLKALFTTLTILASVGLIGTVIYFGPDSISFITNYWVSIVTILGICALCLIICLIIRKVSRRLGLKALFTTLTILAAVGLIGTVLYSGPVKTKVFFFNLYKGTPKLEQKTTSFYANVNSDALNVRSGPSVSGEIVGQLFRDQRVEIVDKSEQWWKIKFDNIEGYVNSDFLQSE